MTEQFMTEEEHPLSALVIGLGGSGAWTTVHVKKHLLDMYDGAIPKQIGLVVFDTADKTIVKIGRVELEPHEYAHVGGDAYDLVRQVAETDSYPHIKSWLLADRYLRELPRNLFHLDKGAGQFRQLGRLALFRSVAQPANSPVAAVLDTKLTKLARLSNNTILVMLIGSLVGGTGAGLFLDVPHIIRRVAKENNINVTLRGFFYLPQAFISDIPSAELEPARARAFAAMRELQRFLLSEDYKYGYPMYYHAPNSGVNPAIWRAKNQEKLYDFVYLLDGGGDMRMNARELAEGSASVVADAIASFVDPHFGEFNNQLSANMPAKISERQGQIGKRAMVSTLGAFSIILPVPQMVEQWAYQLGREIVGKIVPGDHDEQGFLRSVRPDADPGHLEETPEEEVHRILTAHIPLLSPDNPEYEIHPTQLWEQIYRYYERQQQNRAGTVRELSAYDLRTWLNALVPGQSGATAEFRAAILETRQIIEDAIYNHVQASDKQKPRGDPRTDWRRIKAASERYITSQLGPLAASGGREGGRYKDALNRFIGLQVKRFREYLQAYLYHNLNGTSVAGRDSVAAKTGKLGWVLATLQQMHLVFASVAELFEEIRTSQNTYIDSQRRSIQESLDAASRNLEEKAPETRRLIGRSPALEAQDAYLRRVEEYVAFYRTEFARQAVAYAIQQLDDQLQQAIDELRRWAEVLGTDQHSLYNEILVGERTVIDERHTATKTANHEIINDAEWEARAFNTYIQESDRRPHLYQAWNWVVRLDGEKIDVGCQFGEADEAVELRKDKRGKWAEHNRQVLIKHMQNVFRSALERESVLRYLMETYTDRTDNLADHLAQRSGYLLSMGTNPLTQNRVLTNYLLAKHDAGNLGEMQFLERILRRLAAKKGMGDIDDQDTPTLSYLQCANPYRLTVLSTVELIGLRGIDAYSECQKRYMATPYDTRQTTHIFPAEVHAVPYEKELRQLKQPPRLLEDRVVLLLEREDRFLDFLFLLVHGIILKTEFQEGARTLFAWVLRAPDPNPRRAKFKDWWLTMPTDDEPSLLEAMVTYVLLEEDIRGLQPNPEIRDAIPYDHILRYLDQARYEDTLDRVERDQLAIMGVDAAGEAILDEELRGWVEAFMAPIDPETGEEILDGWDSVAFYGSDPRETYGERQPGVAELVVRHDMAHELRGELESQLPALKAQVEQQKGNLNSGAAHDDLRIRQEMFDLYTIAILALDKEMDNLRQVIKRRYESKLGANRRL